MCGAPPRNVCDVAHLGDPGLEMVPVPLWEQTLALVMRNPDDHSQVELELYLLPQAGDSGIGIGMGRWFRGTSVSTKLHFRMPI